MKIPRCYNSRFGPKLYNQLNAFDKYNIDFYRKLFLPIYRMFFLKVAKTEWQLFNTDGISFDVKKPGIYGKCGLLFWSSVHLKQKMTLRYC